jgi:hypothetical protein
MRDAAFALKPGESEQAQWPLNFWYQFEGEGEYEVSVTGHTEDEILVRIHAIEGLGHSGDASDQTLISGYLEDKDGHIQLAAMVAIA